MDQSDGAMAVVASLRRSGMLLTDADLRHRAEEKKPSGGRPPRAVDFCARVR
jgi:hypothetical protein